MQSKLVSLQWKVEEEEEEAEGITEAEEGEEEEGEAKRRVETNMENESWEGEVGEEWVLGINPQGVNAQKVETLIMVTLHHHLLFPPRLLLLVPLPQVLRQQSQQCEWCLDLFLLRKSKSRNKLSFELYKEEKMFMIAGEEITW